MSVIINNSLTADENKVRVDSPIFYVPDPDKGKPLSGFKAYFGIVGLDPLVEENRKLVYALQEDGSAIPIEQPVIGGTGGTPMYNGSPVSLAVSGSYSRIILDSNDVQKYNDPNVKAANFQGFSGVIAEESQTVTSGNLTLTYGVIEATTSGFYISKDSTGTQFKGSYLQKDVDYLVLNATQITLVDSVPDGTVVIGRQMDPTGQVVPVSTGSSALFVYRDIASAKAADLQVTDTVTINGGVVPNDGLGGNKYITVAAGTGIADDENFIDLNNGNQLQATKNNLLLARYAEVTNSSTSVAGNITLDLNNGNVHKIVLSENVSGLFFTNVNPDAALTTTVTLKVTQDPVTPRTITYPANIKWSVGTAPTMTPTVDAVDRYVFVSDDGGATWFGGVFGQAFS